MNSVPQDTFTKDISLWYAIVTASLGDSAAFYKIFHPKLYELNVLYSLLEEAYFDGYDTYLIIHAMYFG